MGAARGRDGAILLYDSVKGRLGKGEKDWCQPRTEVDKNLGNLPYFLEDDTLY
jgi:hypothetical protein